MKKSLFAFSAMALLAVGANAKDTTRDAVVKSVNVNVAKDSLFVDPALQEAGTLKVGYMKLSGGNVACANAGWGVNEAIILQVDASAIKATGEGVVSATLSMEVTGSTDGKRNQHYYVGTQAADVLFPDTTVTKMGFNVSVAETVANAWGPGNSSSNFTATNFDITKALENDEDGIFTLVIWGDQAAGGYVRNPAVSAVTTDAIASSYTINFIDEDYEPIKDPVVVETFAGQKVTIADLAAYKTSFVTEDRSHKYSYELYDINDDEDLEELVINADPKRNVFNLYFSEVEKVEWAVKSSLGDVIASGEEFQGETVYVHYPRVIAVDGKYYYATRYNTGAKIYCEIGYKVGDPELVIDYAQDENRTGEVVFCAEAENIEGFIPVSLANAGIRCSNGAAATLSEKVQICTLPRGYYEITLDAFGGEGETYKGFAGDVEIVSWDVQGWIGGATNQFFIEEETPIYIDAVNHNPSKGADIIIITKLGDEKPAEPTSLKALNKKMAGMMYNLAGQRVNKGAKGIILHNGKKFIQK